MKKRHCRILTAALFTLVALAWNPSASAEEIDWDKARALRMKAKQGETLNDEEKSYLEKAMKARAVRSPRPTGDPTRGDGTNEKATADYVEVSEETSPVNKQKVTASDGNSIEFVYRVPAADGPLPAVVFFHGGLGIRHPRELTDNALTGPMPTRFLDAGFVSVCGTFRTYGREPNSRGPILDAIAIVEAVKDLPEVDPESIVVFGGSGGGSIALELAGESSVSPAAVIAGEPATVLFTGVMTSIANREDSMKTFQARYTEEKRKTTEAKINAIQCPILIHHGDQHLLRKINFELVFPAIEKAGKSLTVEKYPGEQHGFYWGYHTTTETLNTVFERSIKFIEPLLNTPAAQQRES